MGKEFKERKVTVGLIQTALSENIEENVKRSVEMVREAAERGARIVCLQELFNVRYFPQYKERDVSGFAKTVPGEWTEIFSALAKELEVVIILPLFEKGAEGRCYNSAVVIDADGSLMQTYRKMHIPDDTFFYEKDYFEEGDKGYCVYRTRYACFGVFICYDQWFPETARIAALEGAEIIFYPTAIGRIKGEEEVEGDWHNAWETVQRGHSISNGVYIATVNRVGEEGRLQFWGGSFVSDPFGNILKRASAKEEEVLVCELGLEKNRVVQEGWGFLKNRRPESYGALVR